MPEQYFIPPVEDVRVGYECKVLLEEYPDPAGPALRAWVKAVVEKRGCRLVDTPSQKLIPLDVFNNMVENGRYVKTPFLSKEQIEAEGWVYVDVYRDGGTTLYRKDQFELIFHGTNRISPSTHIVIKRLDSLLKEYKSDFSTRHQVTVPVFQGDCKDINTLRTISKLLRV